MMTMTMRSRLRSKEGWKKSKVLGSGSYGTVHLAHQCGCSSGAPLAVKSALARSDAVESLKWEGGVMRKLIGAPNVVECYGDDVSHGVYSLLLEYAPCGTLRDLIRSSSPMDELHVACYAAMLLNGLVHVHSRGLVHCDLKASNILVFPGSSGPGPVIKQLKIADFGVSETFTEDKENMPFDSNSLDSAKPASPSSDVLALGCILCEMIGGGGNLDEFRKNISADAKDFLLTCLLKKLNSSCTARELLKHPFIETNLKIMSDLYGVGLNLDVDGTELGAEKAWVSQRNLFPAKPASLPMSCRRSLAGNSMKPIHFR